MTFDNIVRPPVRKQRNQRGSGVQCAQDGQDGGGLLDMIRKKPADKYKVNEQQQDEPDTDPPPAADDAAEAAPPRRELPEDKLPQPKKPLPLKHEVVGRPGFAEVVVTLQPRQQVQADGGALQWMRGGVTRGELKVEGVASAFGRLFGGESVFMNVYEGIESEVAEQRKVCFASPFPGDILSVKLKPGQAIKVSRGAYIASTADVRVSGALNWRGILPFGQEEGLVLPTLQASENADGMVFIGAFGSHQRHDLKEGDELLIDNGLFLACPENVDYKIVQLGRSLLSSFLGGEGLGMQFMGPCTVYTQSRNFNDFVAQIAMQLPQGSGGGSSSGFSIDFSVGGAQRGGSKAQRGSAAASAKNNRGRGRGRGRRGA